MELLFPLLISLVVAIVFRLLLPVMRFAGGIAADVAAALLGSCVALFYFFPTKDLQTGAKDSVIVLVLLLAIVFLLSALQRNFKRIFSRGRHASR